MSVNKVKSYVKQFVALVSGDDAEVQGEKVLRQVDSALKTHIAIAEGEQVRYEDAILEAEENLTKARLNYGKVSVDRDQFVRDLLSAKNRLLAAVQDLEDFKERHTFLKTEYENLK